MPSATRPAPSGPAHVAVVSFLAARAAPTGGFWIALAGGVALARVAQRRDARQGYGASLAAMLETVAIIGPARFAIPFTQAISAPMLGRLDARSVGVPLQVLACGLVRVLHNSATTAFFIWVITGGLDAYAGTYDALGGRLGLEIGTADALVLTALGLIGWALFASTVQVLVYRRGLRDWDELAAAPLEGRADPVVAHGAGPGRFDPRAVALAAAVAFGLLLASTAWVLLACVSAWLALAWATSRPDAAPVPTGLALAALLALGALIFGLGGGLGLDVALRRALRAALLVLVATWLRSAARAEGLREVTRRALGRVRRLPAVPETTRVLDEIASEGRLLAAGRSLTASLRGVEKSPLPVLDAVLGWVVRESTAFRPGQVAPPAAPLRARPADWALLALAAAPALALA
jgi:hypothetical protein